MSQNSEQPQLKALVVESSTQQNKKNNPQNPKKEENSQKQHTESKNHEDIKQDNPYKNLIERYEKQHKQLIQQIRAIQNSEVDLEVNEQLNQQIKQENVGKIKQIVVKVMAVQYVLDKLDEYSGNQEPQQKKQVNKQQQKQQSLQQKQQPKQKPQINVVQMPNMQKTLQQIQKQYKPTQQQIQTRYTELIQQANDSSWTDATQSQADDDILVLDEEIMQAIEDEYEMMEQEGEDEEGHGTKQGQAGKNQAKEQDQEEDQFDLEQLEDQFVVGQDSDHLALYGTHDKFCVSVTGLSKESLLVSGGGDDYMYMYKLLKDETAFTQNSKDKSIAPYHIVKHTQTVNKVQISYSRQYIFSMTDNEVLCTQIKTKQTNKLKFRQPDKQKQKKKQEQKQQQKKQEEKLNKKKQKKQQNQSQQQLQPVCTDMACHHLGDVVALSSGFQLQIYNIKGLKHYQTYYCESMINMIKFTQTGKQIVLVCEDNKLRLLTPKTSQIVTVTGVRQHQSEISVVRTKGDIILSGCIDGNIGVSTIKKATMMTLIGTRQTKQPQDLQSAINQLQFAGNYFIAGSSAQRIDWYDLSKHKRLFQSPIQGSSSDICWQGADYQHLYNISTIKGYIHVYDCRNPLKQVNKTRAGNTIHQLWCDSWNIVAACEDGNVRQFDIRKLI